MRTRTLRLPTTLPVRPRLEVCPFDVNGWLDQEDAAAPRSDHSPTAPPGEGRPDQALHQKYPGLIDGIDQANARILHRCREGRKVRHVTAARAVAELTKVVIEIGNLLHSRLHDPLGLAAVINLIDDGILTPVEQAIFKPELRVLATPSCPAHRGDDHA